MRTMHSYALLLLTAFATLLHAAPPDPANGLGPMALAVNPDGSRLVIAEACARQLVQMELPSGRLLRVVPIAGSPLVLTASPDGRLLYVALGEVTGRVVCLSADTLDLIGDYPSGHTPTAMVLSPDLTTLYVANRFNGTVERISVPVERGTRPPPLEVGREPVSLAITPDGQRLFVAHHLPDMASTATVVAAGITIWDPVKGIRTGQFLLPNGSTAVRNICLSPDGKFGYVTHIIGRFQAPATQLERGWMMTAAMTVFDAHTGTPVKTILLDDFDRGAANPWGITCSNDGAWIYTTHSGTHEISRINREKLHRRIGAEDGSRERLPSTPSLPDPVLNDLSLLVGMRDRIPLPGNGPRVLAIHGNTLYVAEYFSDTIAVMDTSNPTSGIRTLHLGQPTKMSLLRRGEQVFHDATLCFQHWQSCASCHPDMRADGLNWDLLNDGIGNPKNTKSLITSHLTPPVMVSGVRDRAETAVRTGFRFIQFHDVNPADAEAVDAYLRSLQPIASPHLVNGQLSERARRGEKAFQSAGCVVCHPPPLFTDGKAYDIGLGKPGESVRLFDTPTILENWRTAPYLYDGRANTMLDVLTLHNPQDRHGKTRSLATNELQDLMEYLLSL